MLNVSIVLYNSDTNEVISLVHELRHNPLVKEIFLVDNSKCATIRYNQLPITYIHNAKNIGYGRAHNVALRQTITQNIPYHLVLNSDISFQSESITQLIDFMDTNINVGSLMPKIFYPNGKIQYLCKLIPTPFDLFSRRFLPHKWIKNRTKRFELQDFGYDRIIDIPYLSGCFMLLRTEILKEVGLFDERFFLYPEDIDLTRRIHERYRTVFYPNVQVIHAHAHESYKNMWILWIHVKNIIIYFNKWGWFFDKKRKLINQEILKQLNK